MKNSTAILLLFAIIFSSCNSDDRLYQNLEELPIRQSLPIYLFDLDENDYTGEIHSYFSEPYIVNSENGFPEIFRVLSLEVHADLKNINYDEYSLILLFGFHAEEDPQIQQFFYKNTEYDQNSEYEYFYWKYYEAFNPFADVFYYYTGIVVDKIPDNSKIRYRADAYSIIRE